MKFIKRGFDEDYFSSITERFLFLKSIDSKLKLIKPLKSKGNLLEIGCGKGLLLEKLKDQFQVWGIDVSDSAINEAKTRVDRSRLLLVDVRSEPNFGRCFDIVVAFDVLEHLREPARTIDYIRKILKTEGRFVFSVPNNYGFYGRIATYIMNFFDRTHISTYPKAKWTKLITKNGFKIEDIYNKTLFGIHHDGWSKYLASSVFFVVLKKDT